MSGPSARMKRTGAPGRAAALGRRYRDVRARSERLAAPLTPEDCQAQSMADASPVKWHLAHTTWFFETFLLEPAGHATVEARYRALFNSYYAGIGASHPRPERGLLTRPALAQVLEYRHTIDRRITEWLERGPSDEELDRLEVGCEHEGQHQELLLTDVKHLFSRSAMLPAYAPAPAAPTAAPAGLAWLRHPAGFAMIGAAAGAFAFDHERPRHRVWLESFELASRLVTNREYQAFIDDGGYARPELWHSEGWEWRRREDWQAPLYWLDRRGGSGVFTLAGVQPLALDEPVCHVSWFEASAYARWARARLPTEGEWECAAQRAAGAEAANVLESGRYHPAPAGRAAPAQLYGDCWEWTGSAFAPYPGFTPLPGILGEYNGKFMANQMVLRGGSCVTPASQARATSRNFFPPHARWQFSGLRMAR